MFKLVHRHMHVRQTVCVCERINKSAKVSQQGYNRSARRWQLIKTGHRDGEDVQDSSTQNKPRPWRRASQIRCQAARHLIREAAAARSAAFSVCVRAD